MTQSELLKLAIEKAGGKKQLSELTGLRLAFFYEWEKGKAIKFDVMVHVLEAVGMGLKTYSLKTNEKKEFFVSVPNVHAEKTIKNNFTKKEIPEYKENYQFQNVCDCHLDSKGLLRRGKIKCTKPKSEHKF